MTLREKIERESPEKIYLYREGMFWKLYNRSAFHFFRLIRPYVVKKKYIKELKTEVVSMGFPHSILADTLERLKDVSAAVETGEREIGITLQESQVGYEEWVQQFPCVEKDDTPVSAADKKSSGVEQKIVQSLRDFPIMQKTPLEVQLFVLQLQERLKTAGIEN